MVKWTPEIDAQLIKYWAAGWTASKIAKRMGIISRSAILGRVHRIGLSGRPSPIRPKGSGKKPNQPKKRDVRRLDIKIVRESDARAALPKLPPVEPLARRLLITGACCWPTSNGRPWTFCEAPAMDGRPYCAAHHDLAYQQRPLARL